MLAWLVALWIGLAAADDGDVMPYEPGEAVLSAFQLEEGEIVARLAGPSTYQLNDRVQLRSALLANLIAPNFGVHYSLSQTETRATALSVTGAVPWPFFGVVGVGAFGMIHHSVANRNYRPSYLNVVGGVGMLPLYSFRGGAGSYTALQLVGVEWDQRLDHRSRLRISGAGAVAEVFALGGAGVGGAGSFGLMYQYAIGNVRIGGGATWVVPPLLVGPFKDVPVLPWFLPHPVFELSARF